MLNLEQLPAKEKKKRLEEFESKEKEELHALIEKRKKSATKKKDKEKETKKDEYSGKFFRRNMTGNRTGIDRKSNLS